MINQDVQVHTSFSDGLNSIQEVVEAFIGAGIKSVVITDHAKGWKTKEDKTFEFFPNIERFEDYINQINFAKKKYGRFINILSGLEVEINIEGKPKLDQGVLDYTNKHGVKKYGLDVLLGSIHSESFEEDCHERNIDHSRKRNFLIENTLNLIKNKEIDVFAHPFQAVHGQFSSNFTQEETDLIIDTIIKEQLSGHKIFIEINGKRYPMYEQWSYNKYEKGELETHDVIFLHLYKMRGGKFVLGSDAHSIRGLTETDFSVLDKLSLKESEIFTFS